MENDANLIRTLSGHTQRVSSVRFCPNGKHAVSGSWDNTLILWDTETGEAIRTFKGHQDKVHAIDVSGDGKFAVSGAGDGKIMLWDLATGETIRTFDGYLAWVWALANHRPLVQVCTS